MNDRTAVAGKRDALAARRLRDGGWWAATEMNVPLAATLWLVRQQANNRRPFKPISLPWPHHPNSTGVCR